jgi:hypothetical protein
MDQAGQVEAWHGSPHKFNKFRTSKIGTGEGAQSFGWGIYFTDKKDIAKHYAERLGKPKAVIEGKEYIGEDEAVNAIAEHLKKKYPTLPSARRKDVAYFTLRYSDMTAPAIIKNGIGGVKPGSPSYDTLISAIADTKELITLDKNLYAVSLHKGKDPSEYEWLDWYEKVPDSIEKKLYNQFKKEKESLEEIYTGSTIRQIQSALSDADVDNLYNNLSHAFGSQKEASLFLLRADIDGIRYPAGTLSGIKGSKAKNYVVFDDDAITINEVLNF